MKDLSLHILDIVQNSISAEASHIRILLKENTAEDTFTIEIEDDGKGIAPEDLEKVVDPYFTSRQTRKVGLGIPLFKQNAEASGGSLTIISEPGKGTTVTAVFGHSHFDRPPLGDIAGVVMILTGANPQLDFIYHHMIDGNEYIFNTLEIKEILEDLPISDPAVIRQLKEMINENLKELLNKL
jgi:hypothetical protein